MKDVSMANRDSMHAASIKNITLYKVTVSIIFGLLGLAVNFRTINFAFPPYTATVLIGLLFPMLITLTWGWKYGLLSALAGGCQSMWWLWGPSNGYATFFVVPPFTLWIVWHGLFANWRRKQKQHKWWLNTYAVEIPFRILSTINLYTLSRWAITLNPPPWNWASGAPNTIPMHFSNFVVIKQCVVGYTILLLADMLLNFRFVGRFFRLKEDYDQVNTGYIISASLLLGFLFWIVDSVLGSLVFHTESSFLDLLALDVPPYEAYVRTFFILSCLAGGMVASKLLRRQRESDKALRASEKRLSQIVEGSSTPIFVIDEEHTVTHWNKACENLTGVSASEMVGTKKQWAAFYAAERPVMADLIVDELAEEDIARYYNGKCQRSTLTEGAYEAEDFFPDFGESGKWLFFTAAPLRDRQGKPVGAMETLQDTSERKRAEEALRASEEQLRLVVQSMPVMLDALDADTNIIVWNRECEQVTGYSAEEIIGHPKTMELLYPDTDYRQRILAEWNERGSTFRDWELELTCRDGTVKTVAWSNISKQFPIPGWHAWAIGVDVTERKRAEEALRESEERLGFAMEAGNLGSFDWRTREGEIFLSPQYYRMLDYDVNEEFVSQDWWFSLIHPDDKELVLQKARNIMTPNQTGEGLEFRVIKKTGETCWILARAIAAERDEGGIPIRIIGVHADITERVRAQQALQEYSERLEEIVEQRTQELRDAQEQLIRKEKLAVLGQLAGGVGHELRNPLGVISNAIYFLKMTLAEADETTREYLNLISSEVHDADTIVSDLLDFSRTRMADREEVAASDLISQVLKKRPPPENVEVTTEISPDLPPVFVDHRQIGQVLDNLVTNAYQAMPDGGRLMIHVSEDEGIGRHGDTGTGRPGDDLPITPSPCLRVSIIDTGCGISEENMGKIFEPLFTTKAKGIGLGLAVSKNLVEANGGSIEVESEMGKGSTFTVGLPLARLGTRD